MNRMYRNRSQPDLRDSSYIQDNRRYPGLVPETDYNKTLFIHPHQIIMEYPEIKGLLNNCICNICYSIPYNPQECIKCSGIFCNYCYRLSKESRNVCPKCKNNGFGVKKPFFMNEFLNLLPVKCSNDRCEVVSRFSEYKTHLINCYYRKYKCINENCQCIGIAEEMLTHVSQCGYKKVKCYYCQKEICQKDLQAHESDVECLKLRNKQLTLELEKLKKDSDQKYKNVSDDYNNEKNRRQDLENKYNNLNKEYEIEKNKRENFETLANELQNEKEETSNAVLEVFNKLLKKNHAISVPKQNKNKNSRNTFKCINNYKNNLTKLVSQISNNNNDNIQQTDNFNINNNINNNQVNNNNTRSNDNNTNNSNNNNVQTTNNYYIGYNNYNGTPFVNSPNYYRGIPFVNMAFSPPLTPNFKGRSYSKNK